MSYQEELTIHNRYEMQPGRPYEGEEPYIFISYRHVEFERVYPIIKDLIDRGYRVWFDEGIEGGSEWRCSIQDHVENCHVFIPMLNSDYCESRNCRNELNIAYEDEKTIIPVYLDPPNLTHGMRTTVSDSQGIFKFEISDDALFLERLLNFQALEATHGSQAAGHADQQTAQPQPSGPSSQPHGVVEALQAGRTQQDTQQRSGQLSAQPQQSTLSQQNAPHQQGSNAQSGQQGAQPRQDAQPQQGASTQQSQQGAQLQQDAEPQQGAQAQSGQQGSQAQTGQQSSQEQTGQHGARTQQSQQGAWPQQSQQAARSSQPGQMRQNGSQTQQAPYANAPYGSAYPYGQGKGAASGRPADATKAPAPQAYRPGYPQGAQQGPGYPAPGSPVGAQGTGYPQPSVVKRVNKNLFVWLYAYVLGFVAADRFYRGQYGIAILKICSIITIVGYVAWIYADWIIAMVKAYGQSFKGDDEITFVDGKYAK